MTESERSDAIIDAVCEEFRIAVRDLKGDSRQPAKLISARILACNALHTLMPELSYPTIGRLLNRDHTTVMYHVQNRNGHRATWPPAWVRPMVRKIEVTTGWQPTWPVLLALLAEALGCGTDSGVVARHDRQ